MDLNSQSTAPTMLKRILEEDGRKQKWLAERVGVSEAQMSAWVNGLHVRDEAMRASIAEALGRHVDKVFPPSAAVAA